MYIGVDIGGTKTLTAVFDDHGTIIEQNKFLTPLVYEDFLTEMAQAVDSLTTTEFDYGALAMPVLEFNRRLGIGVTFGNLPWKNVPIHDDIERLVGCPFLINNDAKLGGLSEALLVKQKYSKVLYITISTGIGYALIVDGFIDNNAGDGGGRTLALEYRGKMIPWEDFASGRAIVQQYGKKAMDIKDQETWKKIVLNITPGLKQLIAVFTPEVIIIGGSVGSYFDRYGKLLQEELHKNHLPLLPIPDIIGAKRAEEAVVYGCYYYIKQMNNNGSSTN